jgi:hypothetical protein
MTFYDTEPKTTKYLLLLSLQSHTVRDKLHACLW